MIVASENREWTPETILNRGLKMLDFLCQHIGEEFENIEKKDKYKLLGLEFMYKEEFERTL